MMEAGNFRIFNKIIAGYGPKKKKSPEGVGYGQAGLDTCNSGQTTNCQCHMDTAVYIKPEDPGKQLHITKVNQLLVTPFFS